MSHDVLILSSDYKPVDILTWQQAFTKLLSTDSLEYVYAIDNTILGYNKVIRDGKGNEYQIPAVLRLKNYVHAHNRPAVYSKESVYARDGYHCQYCGRKVHRSQLTIDHVIPKAHWNPKRYSFRCSSFENCVAACKPCNQRKANRTPTQAGMTLIRKPKGLTNAEIFQRKYLLVDNIPSQWRNFVTDV